jgi:hypothetical protein
VLISSSERGPFLSAVAITVASFVTLILWRPYKRVLRLASWLSPALSTALVLFILVYTGLVPLPRSEAEFQFLADEFPAWALAVAAAAGLNFGAGALALFVLGRLGRSPEKNRCPRCGYELCGLPSSTCPECGTSAGVVRRAA